MVLPSSNCRQLWCVLASAFGMDVDKLFEYVSELCFAQVFGHEVCWVELVLDLHGLDVSIVYRFLNPQLVHSDVSHLSQPSSSGHRFAGGGVGEHLDLEVNSKIGQ